VAAMAVIQVAVAVEEGTETRCTCRTSANHDVAEVALRWQAQGAGYRGRDVRCHGGLLRDGSGRASGTAAIVRNAVRSVTVSTSSVEMVAVAP
jgi:hypothetical protein